MSDDMASHASRFDTHKPSPYGSFDDHPYNFTRLKPRFSKKQQMNDATPEAERASEKRQRAADRRGLTDYDTSSVGLGGTGFSGVPAMFLDDDGPHEASRSNVLPPAFTMHHTRAGFIAVPNLRRAKEPTAVEEIALVSRPQHKNQNPERPHIVQEPADFPSPRLTRPDSQRPWPRSRSGLSREQRHYERVLQEKRNAFEPGARDEFVDVPLDEEEEQQRRKEKGKAWLKDWVDVSAWSH